VKGEIRTRLFSWLLVIALFTAFACGGDSDEPEDTQGGGAASRAEATLLLSFLHDISTSYFYLAQDRGYLDECSIDLELLTAAEVENPVQLLVTGEVDYAVLDPLSYIASIHRGLPVIAIAEDFAKHPAAYASLKESNIEGLEDFPSHVVGLQPGLDFEFFIKQMMSENLTPEQIDDVELVPVGFEIQPLLTGRVDIYSTFSTSASLAQQEAEGQEFNFIKASDFGIEVPGNVIVTSTERVQESPDEVKRVLAALLKGMEDNKEPENADESIDAALERMDAPLDREVMADIYTELAELRSHPVWDTNGVGWNVDESYAQAQEILFENGELEEELPVDSLYTNEFLEEIHNDEGRVSDLSTLCS
jgi:NitT/TauT family transport system substrate-binding protein